MTRKHPTREELQGFAAASLDSDALAEIDTHLTDCADCRETMRLALDETRSSSLPPRGSGLLAAIRREQTSHLTYEELAGIVDGREAVRDDPFAREHLARCATCRQELDDLRAFDALPVPVRAASAPTLWERLRDVLAPPPVAGHPGNIPGAVTPARWRGKLGWMAAAAAAVLMLILLPRLGREPGTGDGAAASLVSATRVLDENPENRLSPDRITRLRAILDGTAPPVGVRPDDRSVDALSPADQELWRWAQQRFADDPLLVGALAQDLGLLVEARAAYRRALDAQPDAPVARRLLEALD